MADRIIKGDSGNDTVIQNNSGSGKIEVNDNATIDVTGTLDVSGASLTTSSAQKQAIVQAGPGSGTFDVSSGTFTTSTAQKQAIVSGGISAGTVLQVLHFQSQETNGLNANWTNLFENAITLKSASSDIIVSVNGGYQLPNGQGIGMRIYRDNSATVTDSDTLVWNLNNMNSSSQNYTLYQTSTQFNGIFTIMGKDTLSGFSVGNTLYYALLCQIYDNSGSAVQVPPDGGGADGGFTMLLMEVQK